MAYTQLFRSVLSSRESYIFTQMPSCTQILKYFAVLSIGVMTMNADLFRKLR